MSSQRQPHDVDVPRLGAGAMSTRWCDGLRLAVLAWVTCLTATGCVHATAGGSVVPGDRPTERDDTPIGPAAGESINELDARKDKLIGEVRGRVQAATGDAKVCENLCSLASSVCEVQEKICDIADANASHDEYLQLCREAKQECSEAQAACISCVDRFTQPRGN